MIHLKPLSKDAVPMALEKAQRYRFLNEPTQAESICLDILGVEPDNQQAIVTLILALTDQFADHPAGALQRARDLLPKLRDEYDRAYYAGIICERRGTSLLNQVGHGAGQATREWLKEALEHYSQAEALRPHGNDDPILRWNACVRLLERHPEATVDDDASSRLMMLE